MKKLLLMAIVALTAAAINAATPATAVFTVNPKMHCENCENKIKSNLRFEKGVKNIKTSIPEQTVTVAYDADKTNPENLISGFKKIGYTAQVATGATAPQVSKGCSGTKACCKKDAKACCKKNAKYDNAKACCKKDAKACCKKDAKCDNAKAGCKKDAKACCKKDAKCDSTKACCKKDAKACCKKNAKCDNAKAGCKKDAKACCKATPAEKK